MATFGSYSLLDTRPNFADLSDRIMRDNRLDVLSAGIGSTWGLETRPKRIIKNTLALHTKKEIDCFLKFYNEHKGRAKAFYIPHWAAHLHLQRDVDSTDTQVRVEPNKYYDLRQSFGNQFSNWLIADGNNYETFNALLHSDLTSYHKLDLSSAVGSGFALKDSWVVPLVLVRFASDKITLKYRTPNFAEVFFDVAELPDEYANPVTHTSDAYFYHIDDGLGSHVRIIDYPRLVSVGSNNYKPANILHQRIQNNENFFEESVNFSLQTEDTSNVLRKYLKATENRVVNISIYKASVNMSNDTATLGNALFSGRIDSLRFGDFGLIEFEATTLYRHGYKGRIPSGNFQKKCLWNVYGNGCSLLESNSQVTSTVGSFTNAKVVYTASFVTPSVGGNPNVDEWLTFGKITINGEVRLITKHNATNKEIFINAPFSEDITGATFTAIAGCNKFNTTCDSKFNNISNFMGFPLLPNRPSYIESITPKSGASKK